MPASFDPSMPAEPPDGVPAMGGILLPFLRVAKICFRRRETKVGQHENDFLLIRPVTLIVDDQGSGHEQLLLQSLMRVHPERAAEAQREVIVGACRPPVSAVLIRRGHRPAATAASDRANGSGSARRSCFPRGHETARPTASQCRRYRQAARFCTPKRVCR